LGRELSIRIRNHILDIAARGQEGHIGSSFSIVEILIASLIGEDNEVLLPSVRIERTQQRMKNFVLSKGHAALALYAVPCGAWGHDGDGSS